MKKLLLSFVLCCAVFSFLEAQVWNANLSGAKYQNPILYSDYSDPDVCRAGEDYWMTASSFNCSPGLPILHSKDMVNWELVNHALPVQTPLDVFSKPQHGGGVWAPAIRFHKDTFYIYYGDPDYGIYMLKTADPRGEWSTPVMVKAGKGLIDPAPLWDEDGKAYISHAWAGSRAGLKSIVGVFPMSPDGSRAIGETRIVFDGHEGLSTIEGTKFHKRNGYYYILAPAGGVTNGWQVALRSKNVYGPYEVKTVLHQGSTAINGPHQGAWVETPRGEHWFYHFQDLKEYGRVVLLQPMEWVNDWPVMGVDKDGDGCGEPVASFNKPNVGRRSTPIAPPESDEFDKSVIGLQWQWHANANPLWSFADAANSRLRLYSHQIPENYVSLWQQPNLLLQKFPAPEFKATTKISFSPDPRYKGERTGLLVMGYDYAVLGLENTDKGLLLFQSSCNSANRNGKEIVNSSLLVEQNTLYLRVEVWKGGKCYFFYSEDNVNFKPLGKEFQANTGQWIGAKMGMFITRPAASNDGGWLDVDWFRVEKLF